MDIQETERIIDNLVWSDLEVDESDNVTVNEVGKWLREQGVGASNFLILKLLSEGSVPNHKMDQGTFIAVKTRLKEAMRMKAQAFEDPQDELKKRKVANSKDICSTCLEDYDQNKPVHFLPYYSYQWKEYSGSLGQDGELPLSKIEDVLFCECNPTKELLDAINHIMNAEDDGLNFEEFCEMLENLPKSGIIDEKTLMNAFQTEDVDGSGYISRAQLYNLLIDNGSDPLKKEDIDEMMDDCGHGDMFKYSDWIQRVMTIKTLTEK